MFDTHCHLNFSAFKKNVEEVYANAKEAGVNYFLIPGTDEETSAAAVELVKKFEGVYAAVGVHPHHAGGRPHFAQASRGKEGEKEEGLGGLDGVEGLERLLEGDEGERVVAVGEVGMDRHVYGKTKYENYLVDEEFVNRQKELLEKQIDLALKYEKSLIIHNREAKDDVLKILIEKWDEKLKGRAVFHCCEPDSELLEFAISHGIYIGVDGDITYRQDKQEFIKKVPIDKLVLETDSPFLLPEPLRTQKKYPNEPKNIPLIGKFIAEILGVSFEKAAQITTENSLKLFKLPLTY